MAIATDAPTLVPGTVNSNRQKVLGRAARLGGGMEGQRVYALQCQVAGCGHVYGEEGIRVHQRRCPRCQEGKPGLPVPVLEATLFG